MNRARWAGAALILATNAVVLLGVAYNRSGEPESRLVLSERELWLQRRHWNQPRSEDSGVALSLKWDVLGAEPQERSGPRDFCAPQPVEWFDAAKLAEIGFDVEQPFEDDPERRHEGYDRRQPARDAFLVLELDGPAYHTALERVRSRAQSAADRYAADPDDAELAESAQAMQQQLAKQERLESRLFVVDAGLDPQALRARHSDRARYAIVRGQVRAWMSSRGCPLGPFRGGPGFWGYVDSLSNDSLHVDLRLRPAITPLLSEGAAATSESAWHAQIHLAVGRRFEPWITDITVTRRE